VWSDETKDLLTDNRQVREQVHCLQRVLRKIRYLQDLASCQRAKTTEAVPAWDGFVSMMSRYMTQIEKAVTANTIECDAIAALPEWKTKATTEGHEGSTKTVQR
jgi:hypothetical protein